MSSSGRRRPVSSAPLSSWHERVEKKLRTNGISALSKPKLQKSQLQFASWAILPACVCIVILLAMASPLAWPSGLTRVGQHSSYETVRVGEVNQEGTEKAFSEEQGEISGIHVAMIFDRNRMNFTLASMRSMSFYANETLVFHMLTPVEMHDEVLGMSDYLPGTVVMNAYDIDLCKRAVAPVWYMAKRIHLSAMCKIFLADILPANVPRVLYVDSDTTVVNDLGNCYFGSVNFTDEQYLGMGVDMGESCQYDPDLCYPIGFEWTIPEGLECATVPFRANLVRKNGKLCRNAGESEPYQYNGGVMLMDLKKMRARSFTTLFSLSAQLTWQKLGHVQANWGEQDMINNFFRFHPEILNPLDCGCNYQFSAARRESKCGNHTVVVAHGWSRQMSDTTSRDKFNLHFNYFRFSNVIGKNDTPPEVPHISPTSPDWNGSTNLPRYSRNCDLQSHECSDEDIEILEEMDELFTRPNVPAEMSLPQPRVHILTRTSGRPTFFREMVESVSEQTYPNIVHLVLTDDPASMPYIEDNPDAVLVESLVDRFHPEEVCEKCGSLSNGASCASAPGLDKPVERQKFFDCFCNTSYPMNDYVNTLQSRVENGWVLYLDDDNLLQDPYAVSELMAHVESEDELVAFRSTLGRVTPHDINFGKNVVMGDFDSSNFMFHSKHLEKAVWPDTRCGDFKVGSKLAKSLPIRWVNTSFIQSNPLREAIGGLGKRQDASQAGVTVIITSYLTSGWRPIWVKEIIEYYLSSELSSLVSRVILVWNNIEEEVPSSIPQPDTYGGRLVVIRPKANSLNNRWVETLPYLDNEDGAVLNLDDDLYTTREGLICMLNWHSKEPTRMVSPFVRRIEENAKYVMDELRDGSEYSVVLPRVMLIPVKYLKAYASSNYTKFRQYVDVQEAHCDDILMNSVALKESNIPPLRVLLPESSIVDFYSNCWSTDKNQTGGLGLQTGRTEKRSECVREIMSMANMTSFKSSLDVGTCLPRGNALIKRRGGFAPAEFLGMAKPDVPCGEREA